jgi:hypothetical protein
MANPPSFILWVEMLIAENPFPVKEKKLAQMGQDRVHFLDGRFVSTSEIHAPHMG